MVPGEHQSCVLQVEAGRDHPHRQAVARAVPGGHHRGGRRRGLDRHADRSREAREGCAYFISRKLSNFVARRVPIPLLRFVLFATLPDANTAVRFRSGLTSWLAACVWCTYVIGEVRCL